MTSNETDQPPPGQGPRPRRRPRYSGTHPKRFEERYKELAPEAHPGIHEHVRAQGRTPAGTHVPVLVAEVLEHLAPAPGEAVVDCTVGYGGHAEAFLKRIGPKGRLVGFDVDAAELERTRARLAPLGGRTVLHRGNFAGIDRALAQDRIDECDVIFADLGTSSMQVDDPARGFSYKHDGPLDMRMDDRLHWTAADLLARLSAEGLSAALLELCDEPDHEAIAHRIVAGRAKRPLRRTKDLAHLVLEAKGISAGRWRRRSADESGDLHPAARTFQALRILVNDELSALGQLLRVAPSCLKPGGRIGIISFQSGEDRLVKQSFRDGLRAGVYEAASDEVIRPGPEERRANPRSASAKFRWARKAPE